MLNLGWSAQRSSNRVPGCRTFVSNSMWHPSQDMFKNDELALSVLLDFLKEGMPKICKFFSDEQIMFLLMPLQHTTHLIFQHLGIITLFEVLKIRKRKCASLVDEYLMQPYDMKRLKDIQVSLKACSEILAIALFHQIGHCIVLTTFGGFPKRHPREFVQKIWDRAGIEHLRTKNPYWGKSPKRGLWLYKWAPFIESQTLCSGIVI